MALSCIVSEIKRDIGCDFFIPSPLCIRRPVRGSPSEACNELWYEKQMVWIPDGEKSLRISLLVLIQYTDVLDTQLVKGQTYKVARIKIPHRTKFWLC